MKKSIAKELIIGFLFGILAYGLLTYFGII